MLSEDIPDCELEQKLEIQLHGKHNTVSENTELQIAAEIVIGIA